MSDVGRQLLADPVFLALAGLIAFVAGMWAGWWIRESVVRRRDPT
jgi:hypothetical protein